MARLVQNHADASSSGVGRLARCVKIRQPEVSNRERQSRVKTMLKLRFEAPDFHSVQGYAWIVPDHYSCDNDGWPMLTPRCASVGELESQIDRMQAELEEIRKRGRRAFAIATTARTDLSGVFP